jgi:predicted HNH restriction endonuclease
MNSPIVYDEAHLERTLRTAFEDPAFFKVPKGIIRHDYDHTHAWRASIARDTAKFVEYFYDGESGSIESGLRRAILYRHEILSNFAVTLTVDFKRGLKAEPEKRIKRVVEPGNLNPYVHWRATWHDAEYKRKTASFSVVKFGESEARRMALEAATANHNPIPKQYRLPDAHSTERWRSLSRDEVERNASKNDYSNKRKHPDPAVNESYPFGYEGGRRAQLHMSIERDRALRNGKVALFLREHGRLFCELCSFSFKDHFPFLQKDIIEVHHVVPLSELSSATRVETKDLMLVCSNCHTAIHQGDAHENLLAARRLFAAPQ